MGSKFKPWFLLFFIALPVFGQDQIPLFKLFPSLEKKIPRIPILTGATPVEQMSKLEKELLLEEGTLWLKNDGGSTEPLAGNKARKLEFLIAEAKSKGARTLVTSGMYGSNHALATAVAAQRFGFKSILILGPQPITEDVQKKLLAFYALGAEMRFHSERVGMGLDMLGEYLRSLVDKKLYYISPGGSDEVGDLGYVNAFLELVDQLGRENLPKRIVLPVGTMGTAAGLLVGSCLAGVFEQVRIEGVGVADTLLTNEISLRKQAIRLYSFIRDHLDDSEKKRLPFCRFMSSGKALKYTTEYYDPGYGAATSEVHDAIRLLKNLENITLEATYSGKAMTYLIADLRHSLVADAKIEKTMFWMTYNSYDLDRIIRAYPWRSPDKKWLELPEKFRRFFQK